MHRAGKLQVLHGRQSKWPAVHLLQVGANMKPPVMGVTLAEHPDMSNLTYAYMAVSACPWARPNPIPVPPRPHPHSRALLPRPGSCELRSTPCAGHMPLLMMGSPRGGGGWGGFGAVCPR